MIRTLTLTLGLLAASALPVAAHPVSTPSEGGRSRAEVLAELEAARLDGSLAKMNRESSYAPEFERPSTRSRAEVLAELDAARSSGLLAKMSRESSYAPEFERGSTRDRAEVLAELERARADGSLHCLNSNRGSC